MKMWENSAAHRAAQVAKAMRWNEEFQERREQLRREDEERRIARELKAMYRETGVRL